MPNNRYLRRWVCFVPGYVFLFIFSSLLVATCLCTIPMCSDGRWMTEHAESTNMERAMERPESQRKSGSRKRASESAFTNERRKRMNGFGETAARRTWYERPPNSYHICLHCDKIERTRPTENELESGRKRIELSEWARFDQIRIAHRLAVQDSNMWLSSYQNWLNRCRKAHFLSKTKIIIIIINSNQNYNEIWTKLIFQNLMSLFIQIQ